MLDVGLGKEVLLNFLGTDALEISFSRHPPLPPEMGTIERRGEDAVVDECRQMPDAG